METFATNLKQSSLRQTRRTRRLESSKQHHFDIVTQSPFLKHLIISSDHASKNRSQKSESSRQCHFNDHIHSKHNRTVSNKILTPKHVTSGFAIDVGTYSS